MILNYSTKVFSIMDLIKKIGSYKHELENHDNKQNMLIELKDMMDNCYDGDDYVDWMNEYYPIININRIISLYKERGLY